MTPRIGSLLPAAGASIIAIMIASQAHALTITSAKIDKGAVQVKGKNAASLALLTWEGQAVAQANNRGQFRFATAALPQDCVGDLNDGATTLPVVIEGCGPASQIVEGPPGPKGDKGDPGPKGNNGDTGPPGGPASRADLLKATHSCPGCELSGELLSQANLRSALLRDASLSGADLRDADLRRAVLDGSGMAGADLSGADLSDATVAGAVFANVTYDATTRCPNGQLVSDQGAGSGLPAGFQSACGGQPMTTVVSFESGTNGNLACRCRSVLSCANNGATATLSFADPTPVGSLVVAVTVSGGGWWGGHNPLTALATLNTVVIGTVVGLPGGCDSCGGFGPLVLEAALGRDVPGWVAGGTNSLAFEVSGDATGLICLTGAQVTVTYIPAW